MSRSINRVVLFLCVSALFAVACGCRRASMWDLASVEGTVTRAGCPLTGFQVVFWADVEAGAQGPRVTGFTDAAGHYQLHTDTGVQGAAIGRYRVCLLKPHGMSLDLQADLTKEKTAKPPAPTAVELPPAYGSSKETPLRAEVRPGPQTLDFDIP